MMAPAPRIDRTQVAPTTASLAMIKSLELLCAILS